jgi:hypothetical protein
LQVGDEEAAALAIAPVTAVGAEATETSGGRVVKGVRKAFLRRDRDVGASSES